MDTDMKKIKSCLRSLLDYPVIQNSELPFIVHHPFSNTSMYFNATEVIDITTPDGEIAFRKRVVDMIENRIETVWDVFCVLNRPYLPDFFLRACRYMSEKDMSEFLGEMWIMVEFPNTNNLKKLLECFTIANKQFLMTAEEHKVYSELPENVTIFRGIQKGGKKKAMSWSLSRETAEWFANRFNCEKGKVLEETVPKEAILAYFNRRNEKEVIVDYRYLK